MPLEGSLTKAAMENGIVVRLDEIPDLDTRYPGAVLAQRAGVNASIFAPLRSQDKVIGVLLLQSVDLNAYDEDSLDLARRVAD